MRKKKQLHYLLKRVIICLTKTTATLKRKRIYIIDSHRLLKNIYTSLMPLTIAFIVACRGPSTVFPSSSGPLNQFPLDIIYYSKNKFLTNSQNKYQ